MIFISKRGRKNSSVKEYFDLLNNFIQFEIFLYFFTFIMAQRNRRPKNQLMKDNFVEIIVMRKKCPQHKCKHCGHQSIKLTFRTQLHLNQCQSYLKHQKKMKKNSNMIVAHKSNQLFIIAMIRFFSQTQLNQMHRTNVMIVYMTNISFNHYENSYVIDSYKSLHSNYKPFSRKTIAEKLLDKTYKKSNFKLCNV